MEYGFNMAILDDARSFPSLWDKTKSFIRDHKDMIHPEANYEWLLQNVTDSRSQASMSQSQMDPFDNLEYNSCQFYSNFEVGSLDFFRGKKHRAYFDYLDRSGGIYYERFGDAPIHTLSVSFFVPKSRIWYFRNIGYAHGRLEQCPAHERHLHVETEPKPAEITMEASLTVTHHHWKSLSHDVRRQSGIPHLACGCTISAIDSNNQILVPYESKQRKPKDACIRLFLGGQWLEKKPEWNHEAEITAGRDGLDGYLLDGLKSNPFQ